MKYTREITHENMAAPESVVSAQLDEKQTPAKLEDLTKEGSPQPQENVLKQDTPPSNAAILPDQSILPEEPRPPWKGVLVQCAKLWSYLSGISTFERANMLRKGREVHKIYVDVIKGKTFLDDQFSYTEFGRMVLQNGTIRAGRAKNAKQIVVARETLYCSGSAACKRACGGYGECIPGCEKTKMRGHKCSYRVKLTMRLGYVNYWFVEVLGDHDQFGSLNESLSLSSASASPCGKVGKSPSPSSTPSDSPNSDAKGASPSAVNLTNGGSVEGVISLIPPPHSLPNTLPTTYSNTMPNSLLTSQSMSLPINLPNNLPMIGQSPLFPSPAALPMFSINSNNTNGAISSHSETYSSGLNIRPILPDYCQELPLPLVKVKKEPVENDYQNKVNALDTTSSAMETNAHSMPNGESYMTNNPKTALPSRAKARKKFTPSQVINPSQKENRQMNFQVPEVYSGVSDQSVNGNQRLNSESFVRKELRDLVARRELDRCLGVQNLSNFNQKEDRQSENWREPGLHNNDAENSYTYVWDEDVTDEGAERDKVQDDLENSEGQDLISRVRQLESHVKQLRNVVLKGQGEGLVRKKAKGREFDFKKYNTRHVALKILYLGWDYHGFAVQEDSDKTIEAALFEALLKTKLIESRETSNYHRCGRTDKGVSAFGQVISIDLRTNLLEGPGVRVREDGTAHERPGSDKTAEIRYCHILNKVFPPEIRCVAWSPVDVSFSARFDCKKRTYKYFFPKANLNLQLMTSAADKLVGEHDFRNLCKMDVGNGVINYMRRIVSAEINVLDERENGYQMCELTIVGLAFLWHQIRCIVAILFLVGQEKEKPEIIDELLNVEKNPRKPQYTMASELPLNLFNAEFSDDVEWIYEADWHEENIKHLQQLWAQHSVRASMLMKMLEEMDKAKVETDSDIAPWCDLSGPVYNQADWILPIKAKTYKPLYDRQMCESLEERMEHYAKRRKIALPSEGEQT